jgi:hypothetical protein
MKIRNLNVPFTAVEYDKLQEKKEKLSWHDFIMKKCI